MSPFDVNMALDAGFDDAIPYTNVTIEDVYGLVQDAIFSRSPDGIKRTGVFIGGKKAIEALDMMDRAKKAMVPPFEISVFADPSGAFTTAAGMVACAEKSFHEQTGQSLQGKTAVIFGGTGPVGTTCALLAEADLVFSAAKAGVQVLSADHLAGAARTRVLCDVNAVPPEGIAGVGVMDNGVRVEAAPQGALGIGALAVGNVKYQTQQTLLRQMIESDSPVFLHFEQALDVARQQV
jgi:methylene-tetrahydromethanopterin dehydrogenase